MLHVQRIRPVVFLILLLPGIGLTAEPAAASKTGVTVKERPIFGLRLYEIPKQKPNVHGCILLREIYRQGLLLAAREYFDCVTRDEVLGESLGSNPCVLKMEFPAYDRVELFLFRGDNAKTPVWQASVRVRDPLKQQYLPHVLMVERMSRGKFKEACAALGLKPRVAGKKEERFPRWLSKYADRMNLTCGFLAVRKLHEIIARGKPDPELLSRLAIGYAELGTLTEYFWSAAPKVFWARGLLYAARAYALFNHKAETEFALAYSLALAGRPREALLRLNRARIMLRLERARTTSPDQAQCPDWARLIEPFCKYKFNQLCLVKNSRRAQYLCYLDAECGLETDSLIKLAKQVLVRLPDCYRIHHHMALVGGVNYQHGSSAAGAEALRKFLRPRLLNAGILPRVLPPLLKSEAGSGLAEAKNRMAIINALRKAGANDSKEMSWACLGRMLHDLSFDLVSQRSNFLRLVLCVDADEYFESQRPVWSSHRYAPVFLCRMNKFRARQHGNWQAAYKGVRVRDVEIKMWGIICDSLRIPALRDLWPLATWHMDMIHYDFVVAVDALQSRSQYLLQRYIRDDPYSPHTAFGLLKYGGTLTEQYGDHIAYWGKIHRNNTKVLLPLAEFYRSRDPQHAMELYNRILSINPGTFNAYDRLAGLYFAKGAFDSWRRTWKQCLRQPDHGLYHAHANCALALGLMKIGEYAEALPYAEAGAGSGAGWAMRIASEVNEMTGNIDRAESWMRRIAERYANNELVWFRFCYRTGRSTARPRALLSRCIAKTKNDTANNLEYKAAMWSAFAAGNYAKALQYSRSLIRRDPHFLYWLYCCAYMQLALGEKDGANATWRKCMRLGMASREKEYQHLGVVSKILVSWLQDPGAARPWKILEVKDTGNGWSRHESYFAAGWVLLHCNRKPDAINMFKKMLLDVPFANSFIYAIAWREVKNAGSDPYSMLRKQAEKQKTDIKQGKCSPAPWPEPEDEGNPVF